ncbi:MAG: hypothetical protein CM15mP66_09760 [Pseudomonadota bacterium]|nr:MAG: hypothetical protein CM15mP66_09760 [Pseudomonadota bacterium]
MNEICTSSQQENDLKTIQSLLREIAISQGLGSDFMRKRGIQAKRMGCPGLGTVCS